MDSSVHVFVSFYCNFWLSTIHMCRTECITGYSQDSISGLISKSCKSRCNYMCLVYTKCNYRKKAIFSFISNLATFEKLISVWNRWFQITSSWRIKSISPCFNELLKSYYWIKRNYTYPYFLNSLSYKLITPLLYSIQLWPL